MLRAVLAVVVAIVFATVVSGEWCSSGSFSCPRPSDDSDEKYCCGYNRCCDDCKQSTEDPCRSSGGSSGWPSFSLWPIFAALSFLIFIISIACRCFFLRKARQRNQSQAVQMAPVAQTMQSPPGQYPQYPPTQPPVYPQYPPGQPPPYPTQAPPQGEPPPYPTQAPPYPAQNPGYPQNPPYSQNPPYPQNPPDPAYPPKV